MIQYNITMFFYKTTFQGLRNVHTKGMNVSYAENELINVIV